MRHRIKRVYGSSKRALAVGTAAAMLVAVAWVAPSSASGSHSVTALALPTKIGVTTKLTAIPPKGKTVAWLPCSLPACTLLTPSFQAATKALGWHLKVITLDTSQPGLAFQQAIDENVNYIATVSIPISLVAPQIAAAKAKGIPVLECYNSDPATGKKGNGLYLDCGSNAFNLAQGKLIADWAIADSKGAANSCFPAQCVSILGYRDEWIPERVIGQVLRLHLGCATDLSQRPRSRSRAPSGHYLRAKPSKCPLPLLHLRGFARRGCSSIIKCRSPEQREDIWCGPQRISTTGHHQRH